MAAHKYKCKDCGKEFTLRFSLPSNQDPFCPEHFRKHKRGSNTGGNPVKKQQRVVRKMCDNPNCKKRVVGGAKYCLSCTPEQKLETQFVPGPSSGFVLLNTWQNGKVASLIVLYCWDDYKDVKQVQTDEHGFARVSIPAVSGRERQAYFRLQGSTEAWKVETILAKENLKGDILPDVSKEPDRWMIKVAPSWKTMKMYLYIRTFRNGHPYPAAFGYLVDCIKTPRLGYTPDGSKSGEECGVIMLELDGWCEPRTARFFIIGVESNEVAVRIPSKADAFQVPEIGKDDEVTIRADVTEATMEDGDEIEILIQTYLNTIQTGMQIAWQTSESRLKIDFTSDGFSERGVKDRDLPAGMRIIRIPRPTKDMFFSVHLIGKPGDIRRLPVKGKKRALKLKPPRSHLPTKKLVCGRSSLVCPRRGFWASLR